MFHPLINGWFKEKYSGMTDAQARAWPVIGAGRHVLVVAPTGSGKTLTAFMGAIDQLVQGAWQGPGVKVLYVSPLKALNNDIRRNLIAPLAELRAYFEQHGAASEFPTISVQTRSGDTTTEERRRLIHSPPDILVTTPESLNIMLCSRGGRGLLGGIKLVILDEVHALVSSKRGTLLVSAVERLTLLCGEFQRIGLSATVRPAAVIASWMGGYEQTKSGGLKARDVVVVESSDQRLIQLDIASIKPPDLAPDADPGTSRDAWWEELAAQLVSRINQNRSTLIFTNSRRLTEKLCRYINDAAGDILAYSHHGSLSKEVRMDVEQRLKEGVLKAIVATSSLELGIDIGSVDKVILVQTPFSVASALQRIGRANHQVGAISMAELIPLHGMDLVYAVVLGRLVRDRDIETLQPVLNPLDVLAQIILALTSAEDWPVDQLYAFIRRIQPYHELSRRFFDLTIEMLAGRYADLPIRELRARLESDVIAGTVRARKGTDLLLYQSGGTIPDRGYYQLRLASDQGLLGELDEEFVWERRLGDQFTLGTAAWRITGITQNVVEVIPANPERLMVPFWKAEDLSRDFHTASAVGDFLAIANQGLENPEFAPWLGENYGIDQASAENLVRFLARQRAASDSDLPSRRHVLVEEITLGARNADQTPATTQLIFHTFWGGKVNKPLALAISAAWERTHGAALEFFAGNESLMFQVPDASVLVPETASGFHDAGLISGSPLDLLSGVVNSSNVETLLRERLQSSGLFGARFRENATRALLLPRGDARRRVPLWLSRMRSRKLLDAVAASPDFPLTVETWRDCLEDEFDLESLKLVLDELSRGEISISWRSGREPSPFAADLVWRQVNTDMYRDDTPPAGKGSSLSSDIFAELLGESRLRPAVSAELAGKYTAKLQGTWPEYRPETPGELVAVLNELGFMPSSLWDELCHFSSFSISVDPAFLEDLSRLSRLFARFRPPGAAVDWIVAVPQLPIILSGLGLEQHAPPPELPQLVVDWLHEHPGPEQPLAAERLLLRWMERQGPVTLSRIQWMFGWSEETCLSLLQILAEDERVVSGRLIEGSDLLRFCESRNYEGLLRLNRTARRQGIAAQPIDLLPIFLATWHGIAAPAAQPNLKTLQDVMDRCIGYPLPAAFWEQVLLPTRLRPYQPSWMDSLFANYGIVWLGCGEGKVFLVFNDELSHYHDEPLQPIEGEEARILGWLQQEHPAPVSLLELARQVGLEASRTAGLLWSLAWKGLVCADSFEVLRRGIRSDFQVESPQAGRGGRHRWEAPRGQAGAWRALPTSREGQDSVDRLESNRELVNQLLRRHGVVFRELLANEMPRFQWSRIFRILRLMELSGEVQAGRFFEGIPGIQFASPEAARRLQNWSLQDDSWESTVWWVNAMDPASVCGLGLDFSPPVSQVDEGSAETRPIELELPRRVATNWLVYAGNRLVMVARRNGREVDTCLAPDDSLLGRVLAFFPFLLSRSLDSGASVVVELVNGQPGASSHHVADFRRAGFLVDHHGLSLWKRY